MLLWIAVQIKRVCVGWGVGGGLAFKRFIHLLCLFARI